MGADRRTEIKMTEDEQTEFLRPTGKMSLSTIGPDGFINTVAMFYGFLGDDVAFLAKSKSQKVVNLRRDPRVTSMREAGETYYELRGLTLIGEAELREDRGALWEVGKYLYEERHRDSEESTVDVDQIIEKSIYKRTVIVVRPKKIVTWDHRKLRKG
jgi:hypothetical protein